MYAILLLFLKVLKKKFFVGREKYLQCDEFKSSVCS
jgi:hypothetical protein